MRLVEVMQRGFMQRRNNRARVPVPIEEYTLELNWEKIDLGFQNNKQQESSTDLGVLMNILSNHRWLGN